MKYVVDTSAILSGKNLSSTYELYTSPRVVNEIKPGGRLGRNFQYLLEAGLNVKAPSLSVFQYVKMRAKRTGDIGRMSETDIEVLALAKELDAVLLTDDYSIQNMALDLGIKYQPIAQEGIKELYLWINKCTGCGAVHKRMHKICPICGSRMKSSRRKDRG